MGRAGQSRGGIIYVCRALRNPDRIIWDYLVRQPGYICGRAGLPGRSRAGYGLDGFHFSSGENEILLKMSGRCFVESTSYGKNCSAVSGFEGAQG